MNKQSKNSRGKIYSLEELRSKRQTLQREIDAEKTHLKSDIGSASNPQAGLQAIQRLISIVSAVKLGYTGYKAYKNISSVIARFKKKD